MEFVFPVFQRPILHYSIPRIQSAVPVRGRAHWALPRKFLVAAQIRPASISRRCGSRIPFESSNYWRENKKFHPASSQRNASFRSSGRLSSDRIEFQYLFTHPPSLCLFKPFAWWRNIVLVFNVILCSRLYVYIDLQVKSRDPSSVASLQKQCHLQSAGSSAG